MQFLSFPAKRQILPPKLKEFLPKLKEFFSKLKNPPNPFVGDVQKLVKKTWPRQCTISVTTIKTKKTWYIRVIF